MPRSQQELNFRTWGGKRAGAGRKQIKPRKSERHRVRTALTRAQACHVTVRVKPEVGGLRRRTCYRAIRGALQLALEREDFRVVHLSIQRTHVHFLIEADDQHALGRGMQGLLISAAKRLNRHLEHRGQVFPDRYHVAIIDSPRQARNALAYVLNNWRRHGEDRKCAWKLDPYSSALSFRGWVGQSFHWEAPETYQRLPVRMPESWLLYAGWAKYGPIGITEVPG